MQATILAAYGLVADECNIQPFGSGLINTTWKVTCGNRAYILQRINHQVFKNPALIAQNIKHIGEHLNLHHPEYFFVEPVQTLDNKGLVITENGEYFRLQPFVPDSVSYDVVMNVELAFEAARQFGQFTRLLSGLDIAAIQMTLPDFHNLTLRYEQFEKAVKNGNPSRIKESAGMIAAIQRYSFITTTFEKIRLDPDFKIRVMHHDTKINNVLFNKSGNGLCVIDLDTVMPGYFISDFGDMMRTYLSPANEEEADFSKITAREEYFKAIVDGYLGELKNELSHTEIRHMIYAGQFMVYMQCIRFLTDYLNDDAYYGAKYEKHNLVRAGNQLTLLDRITEKEGEFFQAVAMHGNSVA
ncbi:Ser/Thr protein kinase RdoA involved in Cpx stress response, MazF antagonist [Chitinophaga sp. CF118]|uniref:phosphotransferase enzyme family protein n=1 Tax=Chitinophaga sp. CF118 TaxID=1884367 RepID=UPI0008E55BEB|nr:aminoglycoside phosphotransferase family protein [Chitinophaga sp. CF118]SFD13384.1 Ser/Thr protein kinase RdoA involved in Cpx stress response, MazF antagonist [Chitinophaga sp. CF118]